MRLTALIIVVAVAVVFFVVFNAAAANRRRKRSDRPVPASPGTETGTTPGMDSETVLGQEEPATAPANPKAAEEVPGRNGDSTYRNALRSLAASEPVAGRESGGSEMTRDHEYREALRSMDKKIGRRDS